MQHLEALALFVRTKQVDWLRWMFFENSIDKIHPFFEKLQSIFA